MAASEHGQHDTPITHERRVDVWLWLAFLATTERDALTSPSDRRGNALRREASDEQIADLRDGSDRCYAKAGEVLGAPITAERWRAAIERFADASTFEEPGTAEPATTMTPDPARAGQDVEPECKPKTEEQRRQQPPGDPEYTADLDGVRAPLPQSRVRGQDSHGVFPTTLGACDLCAEHGTTQPAIAEASLGGGVWFSLCHSHAYRAQSGGFRVHFVARAGAIAPDAIEGGAVEGTVTL